MAHFAQIDEWGYVQQVLVIANEDIVDGNGVEQESLGQQRCEELFGGRWIQTSYNNSIRGKFAVPDDYYDEEKDVFR